MMLRITEQSSSADAMKKAEMLKNGKWMIMYYAYWCPHCVSLKPTYNELAAKCKLMGVKFAMVEATHLNNGMIHNQHPVQGYPTLVTREGNTDSTETYSGPRSVGELKKYIIEKLKLNRKYLKMKMRKKGSMKRRKGKGNRGKGKKGTKRTLRMKRL